MDDWIALILSVVLASLYLFRRTYRIDDNAHHQLPPGPSGLPILGHLHMLGKLPHRNLHKLAQKFGSIMYIRLGLVPTIVVSSSEAAELFLKTHDLVFAGRPKLQASQYIFYGQRDLAFREYGPQWRNIRKVCMLKVLSGSKIESMKPMRKENVNCLVKWLKDAAEKHAVVDVSDRVGRLMEDMTFTMLTGRKEDRLDFKSTVEEMMNLLGAFNIADYIPFVGAFDIQGLHRRMKAVSNLIDTYLESIINEHLRTRQDHEHRDIIDALLSLMESERVHEKLDRVTVKAIVLDVIAAGMDTSTASIEWILLELFKHPRVMKRLQTELENIVGMNRMVEESDLLKLEYLELVIKESMRLHSVGPLMIPHESMEDITIKGYYIPNKSRVIVNVWAIGHDPQIWSTNVEEFYPERFIGTNMDFRGHDMRFIPFGSGRRGCPGVQLGLTNIQLVVAQLVHCFDWELPSGVSTADLDMTETSGLTMRRAKHLVATPNFRLVNYL